MQNTWLFEEDVAARLRAELYDVLTVFNVTWQSGRENVIAFTGQLLRPAESAFTVLRERFARHGYTPLIRKQGNDDVIVAMPGVFGRSKSNPWINVVLLGLTILTTLFAGAMLAGANPLSDPASLLVGAPFAFTLLGILGIHELGHYFLAQRWGVDVTLPYFIPVPFGLGTFGAFIQMKSPAPNKKALFDVGVAGPLAGFIVAIPALIVGLLLSSAEPYTGGSGVLGTSLLVEALVNLFRPHPAGYALVLSPVALAAYFGLLVTGLNLLPIGQLDGGHVAYTLLGRWARPVALATLAGLVFMGLFYWTGWLTWAFLVLLIGIGHPPPLNEVTELDTKRRVLGWLTLALFVLLITPKPF
jgi:membrane-associated protease RseP (regulator of RpoE activity)